MNKIPFIVVAAGLTGYLMTSPKNPSNRLFTSFATASLAYLAITTNERNRKPEPESPLFIHTPDPDSAKKFRNELMEPLPSPVRSPVVTNNKEPTSDSLPESTSSSDSTPVVSEADQEICPKPDDEEAVLLNVQIPFWLALAVILYIVVLITINLYWCFNAVTSSL